MPTAFVTGGSGFIGGALVRRLVADGVGVRALARSDASARAVRAAGAEPVRGDLGDPGGMAIGADGCDVAFHCAAHVGDWGPPETFAAVNVAGTRHALDACARAGVPRFVHVGTEAALLAGQPLVHADERAPLRFDSPVAYCATKARAEEAVLAARRTGFRTVIVRPRLVWGRGDTTILPPLVEAVRSGRFAWVGGGRHRTATTHVDNAVHGLLLAARAPAPGAVYFVTDGPPLVFRDFVTRLLATQGVRPPRRSVPRRVATALAAATEAAWRALPLPGRPPLTRLAVWLSGLEVTIDTSRARTELGYAPVRTVDEGLAELADEARRGRER
jgi:nucleoside-diphosphate-sugar epimerase